MSLHHIICRPCKAGALADLDLLPRQQLHRGKSGVIHCGGASTAGLGVQSPPKSWHHRSLSESVLIIMKRNLQSTLGIPK